MGEGSGWLYLSVTAEQACGELVEVKRAARTMDTAQALHAALRTWQLPGEPLTLLPGFRIEPGEIQHLVQALPDLRVQDYLGFCGNFHSAAAFGIAALFDPPVTPGLFVHFNRDASGHAMFCAVRVL